MVKEHEIRYKPGLFLVPFLLLPFGAQAGDEFRQNILRKAAISNGYILPGKINSEFDKNKSVLGELFFNSKVLSFNSDMSCSTCHLAEFSSADGLPNAVGVGGHGKGRRRALSQGQIVPRIPCRCGDDQPRDLIHFFGTVRFGALVIKLRVSLEKQSPQVILLT